MNELQQAPLHQFGAVPSPFLTSQPNKPKPPLQVLAVVEGNSEKKIRFVGQYCDKVLFKTS